MTSSSQAMNKSATSTPKGPSEVFPQSPKNTSPQLNNLLKRTYTSNKESNRIDSWHLFKVHIVHTMFSTVRVSQIESL